MKTSSLVYTDCTYHSYSEPLISYDQYKVCTDVDKMKKFWVNHFVSALEGEIQTSKYIQNVCRVFTNISKSMPPANFFTTYFPLRRAHPEDSFRQENMFYGGDLNPVHFKVKSTTINYAGQVEGDAYAVLSHYSPMYLNWETGLALTSLYKTAFNDFLSLEHYLSVATIPVCYRDDFDPADIAPGQAQEHTHTYRVATLSNFITNVCTNEIDGETVAIPRYIEDIFDRFDIPASLRCNPKRIIKILENDFIDYGTPMLFLIHVLRSLMDYGHYSVLISFDFNSQRNEYHSGRLHYDWSGMFSGNYGFPVDPRSCIKHLYETKVLPSWNSRPFNNVNLGDVELLAYRKRLSELFITSVPVTTMLTEVKTLFNTEKYQSFNESLTRILFYNLSPLQKGYYFDFLRFVAMYGHKKFKSPSFDHAMAHVIWGLCNSTLGVTQNVAPFRYNSNKPSGYNIEGDFSYDASADPKILEAYTLCLNEGLVKIKPYNRSVTYKSSGHPTMMFVYPTRGTYLKFTTIIKFDFKTKFWFLNDFNNKKVKYPVLTDEARLWYSEKCPGLFLGDVDFMSKKEGTLIDM